MPESLTPQTRADERTRRYLPLGIVITVALLTISGGGLLYRSTRLPLLGLSEKSSPREPGRGIHTRGPADAAVIMVEYADFQCPPCSKLATLIRQLEQEYRPRLRIVFRHFPLTIHKHAHEAALAAEAAAQQDRFWEMHDLLYREQDVWSAAEDARPLFHAYAGILGLNIERFKKEMMEDAAEARVHNDQHEAEELGVANTPTLFVNNRAVPPGALSLTGLRAVIDAALNEAPQQKNSE